MGTASSSTAVVNSAVPIGISHEVKQPLSLFICKEESLDTEGEQPDCESCIGDNQQLPQDDSQPTECNDHINKQQFFFNEAVVIPVAVAPNATIYDRQEWRSKWGSEEELFRSPSSLRVRDDSIEEVNLDSSTTDIKFVNDFQPENDHISNDIGKIKPSIDQKCTASDEHNDIREEQKVLIQDKYSNKTTSISTITYSAEKGGRKCTENGDVRHQGSNPGYEDTTIDPFQKFIDESCFDKAEMYTKSFTSLCSISGYDREFPFLSVLTNAQNNRKLKAIVQPRDQTGRSLPFPFSQSLEDCFDVAKHKSVIMKLEVEIKKGSSAEDVGKLLSNYVSEKIEMLQCLYGVISGSDIYHLQSCLFASNSKSDGSILHDANKIRSCFLLLVCRCVNIPCTVISGTKKNGIHPATERYNVTYWCSVLLQNRWWFIDPNPKPMYKFFNLMDQYGPRISEEFFMCDPVCFIFSHLPTKAYWQQLCRQVTDEEWVRMPYVTPQFVRYKMECISHQDHRVHFHNGPEEVIVFHYPAEYQLVFEAVVLFEGKPVDYDLYSCTFISTRKLDSNNIEMTIRLRVPRTGDFSLLVVAVNISAKSKSPPVFFHACSFKIHCVTAAAPELFLSNIRNRTQWGVGADTIFHGLKEASFSDTPIVHCQTLSLSMSFKLLADPPYSFRAKLLNLRHCSKNEHVFQWEGKKELHVLISCPGKDKFILNIIKYCTKSNMCVCVCSHIIEFSSNTLGITVPNFIENGTLGLTSTGINSNAFPKFDLPPYIIIDDTGSLELKFESDLRLMKHIYAELKFMHHSSKMTNMNHFIRAYLNNDIYHLRAHFPRQGSYALTCHAQRVDGELINFYNSLIEVNIPSISWAPFLIQCPDLPLNIHFEIISPTSGFLKSKSEIEFQIIMADVHDMAVISTSGWFHLKQAADCWNGVAVTGARGTDMKLGVRLESGSSEFTTLCTYKVITEEEYNRKSERHTLAREMAFTEREESQLEAKKNLS